MPNLVVLTPTRGRPERFARMVSAALGTAHSEVGVWAGIDDDDLSLYGSFYPRVKTLIGPRLSLSGWTNLLAERVLAEPDPPRYLASLGDDHLCRTPGWDTALVGEIERMGGTGIAYGNDLFQGMACPTAWVMSADIVRALGWMMLPTCQHMYVDNAIAEVGRGLNRIAYRPDVTIEHLHPIAGKAKPDASYIATNSQQRFAADRAAFEAWRADQLSRDLATLRTLLDRSAPVG